MSTTVNFVTGINLKSNNNLKKWLKSNLKINYFKQKKILGPKTSK